MDKPTDAKSKALEVINAVYQGVPLRKAIDDYFDGKVHKFFNVLENCPNLTQNYECAQKARSELLAEEIIHISDTESCPQTARNRIDARKWYASKIKPNKFGEKLDINMNHTVDISGALSEARARAKQVTVLPPIYTALPTTQQVIDITHNVNTESPDGISGESLPNKSSFDDLL